MPKKVLKVLVFVKNPHPQSLANLVLMNREFTLLDPSRLHWRKRLDWRDSVIQRLVNHGVEMKCSFCGRNDLIPFSIGNTRNKRVVTLDHLHPVSKGGSNHDTNLTLSCERCNGKKGNTILPMEVKDMIPTVAQMLAINVNSNTSLVLA